ncbi:MAG: FHA domain-containing protein, partial [Planctomycetota bacterium]
MRAYLTGPFGTWELQEGDTVIGRGSSCDIRVKDRRLSRQHVRLRWDGDRLTVTDLGSSNGTLANGDPVYGERPLQSRDLLIFGPVACDIYIGELSFSQLPALRVDLRGRVLAPLSGGASAATVQESDVAVAEQGEDRRVTEAAGELASSADETPRESEAVEPPADFQEHSEAYNRQRTESLDPDQITALFPQNLPVDNPEVDKQTTKQALTSRQVDAMRASASGIDPAIRSALDDQSRHDARTEPGEDAPQHTTDHLHPGRSSLAANSSALQPNLRVDKPPPGDEREPERPPQRTSTEIVQPHNQIEEQQRAIETNQSRSRAGTMGWRRHLQLVVLRSCAGLLDGLWFGLLLAVIALPWLVLGWTMALREAHAAVRDGLPYLHFAEPVAAWSDILLSLTSLGGWQQMVLLAGELRQHSQQAFLLFFIGGVLAVLGAVLVLLLAAIAPS